MTAQEDSNTAFPGRKALSSQSRASSSAQPWKASESSPEPLGDIFESPGGLTGTPPESSSRPSSRNTDSSGGENRTSALYRHADPSQDQVDGAERNPGVSAEDRASLSQGTTDADGGGRAAAASSTAAPKRKEQFSLEILRCRAVAPDWRDTGVASSRPYWDRQHALTLNVPQLLLQLPPTDPAKHPAKHPVEVQSFDSASPGTPARQDDGGDGSGHESSDNKLQQEEGSALQELNVVSAVQLAFHVEVFDPGKASHVGYTSPFISIPDVSMTYQGLQPAPGVRLDSSESRPVTLPATRMQIADALIDIAPGRLATLLAAMTWGKSELAHILGHTDKQTPHQRSRPPVPVFSRLMKLSPIIVSASIEKVILRLRGISPMQPVLQLGMTALGAEAVRLPNEAAVGLNVQLPQLYLKLTGLPESSNSESSIPHEQSEKAYRSTQGFGRSASAPSPPLRRTDTAASNINVRFLILATSCCCLHSRSLPCPSLLVLLMIDSQGRAILPEI